MPGHETPWRSVEKPQIKADLQAEPERQETSVFRFLHLLVTFIVFTRPLRATILTYVMKSCASCPSRLIISLNRLAFLPFSVLKQV